MNVAMAQALANFHFLRPLALLLLLAVPLFWLASRSSRADAGAWRGAVDAHLLPHLIERIDGGPARAGMTLAAVLWTLSAIVLAGPAWERQPMPLYQNQSARVLALELAPSMLAQDEKPNRLTRARFKLNDILTRSRDYQTALIGYAGDAFVAAPLTDDVETVRNLVDSLDPSTMPVTGNATGRAIDAATALIEQAGLHRGEIILIADSVSDDAVSAARRARARGFTVSVLGIGTATGAPLPLAQGDFAKDASGNVTMARFDAAGLRAVAAAGDGRYAHLTPDARDLDTLLASDPSTLAGSGTPKSTAETAQGARWRDRGPWFLLFLLPLALFCFRRGWLMTLGFALAVVAPMPRAQAASLADWWQRPDQQAATALAQGDAKRAFGVAHSPQWRGSAAYRAGDYAAALDDYAKTSGADGAYNKGNALAKLGRYEDAINAYDDALKTAPDMADAQANRKAVEDFLARQKSKQKPSPSDKKQGSQGDSNAQQQPSNQDSHGGQNDKKEQGKQGQSQAGQKDQQQGDRQNGDQQKSDQQKSDQRESDQQKSDQQKGEPKQGDQNKDDSSSTASGDAQKKAQEDAQKAGEESQSDKKNASNPSGSNQDEHAGASTAQKPDAAQQNALSKSIDQALAAQPKPVDQNRKGVQQQAAMPVQDPAAREKQQALEHWLQRVPDDPGGLLRRKFQLEYQRRQQRAGEGG